MTRDEMEAESTWIIKEWEDRPANHVPTALELAAVRLARSLTAPAAEPADDPSLRMRIVRWLHTKADEFGQMEPPKRRTAESGWPQMLLHNIANEIFIKFAQPVAPTAALPTPGTPAGSINVEFEVDCEGRVHPVEAAAMLRTVAVPSKQPDLCVRCNSTSMTGLSKRSLCDNCESELAFADMADVPAFTPAAHT